VAGRDCYEFQQNILPLFDTLAVDRDNTLPNLAHSAKENIVYLYYIQTLQNNPNGKGVLKYSFQTLLKDPTEAAIKGTGAGLQVRDRVFGTYEVP